MTDKKIISREVIDTKKRSKPGYKTVLIKTLEAVETKDKRVSVNKIWEYTDAFGELICNALQEGMTLKEITEIPGSPPFYIINNWRERNEKFREMYIAAKKGRAEYYHDKMKELSEEVTENNSKASGVKAKIYQWLAKVNDPLVFGDIKKEVNENAQGGVHIYIDTGVPQKPAIEVVKSETVEAITKEADGKDNS